MKHKLLFIGIFLLSFSLLQGQTLPFKEDFETTTGDGSTLIEENLPSWMNYKLEGNQGWCSYSYNNNKYAQMSSYNTGEPNDAWLITPAIDKSGSTLDKFTFDVKVGYWTHDGLKVLISENFDGFNVKEATWEDITSNFTIPQTPETGWGEFNSADTMDISGYADKIHIAFRYEGNDNKDSTTTYQVDNVQIYDETDSVNVTFNVDFKPFIESPYDTVPFDPQNDSVYISGDPINGWDEPGTNMDALFTDEDNDSIFTWSTKILTAKDKLEYKFFYVPAGSESSWAYGDFGGMENRIFELGKSDTTLNKTFSHFPYELVVRDGVQYTAISGATVMFEDETYTTDSEGKIERLLLHDSLYHYTVKADGYNDREIALEMGHYPKKDIVELTPKVVEEDYNALVAIYNKMNGENWTHQENWLTDAPVKDWWGVTVENKRVTGLDFYFHYDSTQNVSGSFAEELWELDGLTTLNLSNNSIEDSIPSDIDSLTNLQRLNLRDNELTGSIPKELGSLSNLGNLDLEYNQLEGSIPSELQNLTNLQRLDLGGNYLTGSIPTELGGLSNLTSLDLSYNQLEGSIPSEISNLNNLYSLYLSGNGFDSIPDLSPLSDLERCNIDNNYLDFGDLETASISGDTMSYYNYSPQKKLEQPDTSSSGGQYMLTVNTGGSSNEYIWFKDETPIDTTTQDSITVNEEATYQCKITNGNFPDLTLETEIIYIGETDHGVATEDYDALLTLYDSTNGENWDNNDYWLSDTTVNNWYGVTVENSRVTNINLYNNNLSGTIPPEVGNILYLKNLHLGYNQQLGGKIPSELGSLANLQNLYLFSTQLTGSIPSELGNLNSLESIYIHNNKLEGSVPETFDNLSNCRSLNISDNKLDSLPNLTNTNLYYFRTENNQFTFGDLENTGYTGENIRQYAPQDLLLPLSIDTTNNEITLAVLAESPNNSYQWFKDGNILSGETDSILTYNESDTSSYYCKVTNSSYPDLALQTKAVGSNLQNGVILEDYNALASIYNSTDGDNWNDNTNWLSDEPVGSWYGVNVESDRVSQLNLEHNNLTGTFPEATFNLDSLKRLVYWDNDLENSIPDRFDEINKLKYIDLDKNQFTGNIPSTIGSLDSLETAWFSRNNFSGAFDYSTMQNLANLYLHSNQLKFSDLEDVGIIPGDIDNYGYAPQSELPKPDAAVDGDQVTLSVNATAIGNQYIWYRDSTIIDTSDGNTTTVSLGAAADYHCKITNDTYPELILKTDSINLEKNYTVTFNVIDEDSNPIEGATVSVGETDLTTNASGQALLDTVDGTYNYTATAQGYKDTSGTVTVDGTDITKNVTLVEVSTNLDPVAGTNTEIYPNPTSERITIESEMLIEIIKLLNIQGQVVISKQPGAKKTMMKTDKLDNGLYLMHISYSNGLTETRRVMKQ